MATRKDLVAKRAGYACEYCLSQLQFCPDPFVLEHITPLVNGGSDDLSNLALSCQGCNNHKYTSTSWIDPVTGETVPLYHPRLHQWEEHFAWIDNFETVVGRTPTGRATLERLHLNREGVVNLRRALRMLGTHPPS